MFNIFSTNGLIEFLYMLPALLISLSIHELSHAYVAYKLGDKSQKALGRLTLYPFAHIDWLGFISIALIGIGWGKPVMVNDSNFKNKKRDNMLVSLAGPLSNFILAIILTIVYKILIVAGINNIKDNFVVSILLNMLNLTIIFNVIFSVFNMIPLPPFDGSKVLTYFLPVKLQEKMYDIEKYSLIIVAVLFFTRIASYIISPLVNLILRFLQFILNI